MKPEWFERARAKWTREMQDAKWREAMAICTTGDLQPAFDIYRLRAMAKALVLIERASR